MSIFCGSLRLPNDEMIIMETCINDFMHVFHWLKKSIHVHRTNVGNFGHESKVCACITGSINLVPRPYIHEDRGSGKEALESVIDLTTVTSTILPC